MDKRTAFRLRDIIEAIDRIDLVVLSSTFEDLCADIVRRAAFERFLEILSEASRHFDDDFKATETTIPWRKVADIGNHLRHACHRVDFEILWNTWANGDLTRLREAAIKMLETLEADKK